VEEVIAVVVVDSSSPSPSPSPVVEVLDSAVLSASAAVSSRSSEPLSSSVVIPKAGLVILQPELVASPRLSAAKSHRRVEREAETETHAVRDSVRVFITSQASA